MGGRANDFVNITWDLLDHYHIEDDTKNNKKAIHEHWHSYYDDDAPLQEYQTICETAGGRYDMFVGSYLCKGHIEYDRETKREVTTKGARLFQPHQQAFCLPPSNITYKVPFGDNRIIQCDESCTAEYMILNSAIAPLHWTKCGTKRSHWREKKLSSIDTISLLFVVVVVGILGLMAYLPKAQRRARVSDIQDLDNEEMNAAKDTDEVDVVDELTRLNPVVVWEID